MNSPISFVGLGELRVSADIVHVVVTLVGEVVYLWVLVVFVAEEEVENFVILHLVSFTVDIHFKILL